MPCGCFGKKKKVLEEKKEEEKYRQRDSKSREREPPTLTPVPAPAPPAAVLTAPVAPGPPTPEGDARLRPEDDPDKANRRRDVVASFYNDQCELIGFKATGSRPPSALVGGAHHHHPDGHAALMCPDDPSRPMASCRADLAEKRREFFKQLTLESDDGSSQPGTRPGSRTSASQLRTRDSQPEGMTVIQMAKSSLRPVKQTAPQDGATVAPYKPPPLTEEEARGLQHRKARELYLKDIRQHAFALRPSTQEVHFKNMLPKGKRSEDEEEEEEEEHLVMANGDAGTAPLILGVSKKAPGGQGGPECTVGSRSEAKVTVSLADQIKAKRSEQIDPELTQLLDNLSGQEISELLDDFEEDTDLLPAEAAKPECSISLEGTVTSNQTEHDFTLNSHPPKTEPEVGLQQSTVEPVNSQVCADKDDLAPVSSGAFLTEFVMEAIPTVTITPVDEKPIELPPAEPEPLVAEIRQETVEKEYDLQEVPVQVPAATHPVAEEEEGEVPVEVPAVPLPVPEVTVEIAQEPQVPEAREESPQVPVAASPVPEIRETGEPQEEEAQVPQVEETLSNHVASQENTVQDDISLPAETQKPEGGGDPGSVLPPSVDPSFLQTEEEPEELLLQQSLRQPQPAPTEDSAHSLPEPVVEPSLEATSPAVEEEALPPAPPTPPSEPEQTVATPDLVRDDEPAQVPAQAPVEVPSAPPVVAEAQLPAEEGLPPPPPTPPLEEEPLPPAPPTPPMSSPRQEEEQQKQRPPERLVEERAPEPTAASS